jgi:glycosyltransferase involved in cell wall biosynthesis
MSWIGGPGSANRRPGVTRVCMVVESHWRALLGGAELQARYIAEGLAARPDFEVHYLARRCLPEPAGDPYPITRIGNIRGIRRRAVFFDAPELWRTLETLAPDVIYQRMRQSYTAVAAEYARRHGKRFVFHAAHDYDLMRRPFRKPFSLNVPFDWVEALLGNYGIRRAGAIVTQTHRQAELLQRHFGKRAAAVIPNFHPEPVSGEVTERSDNDFLVAWVGNFKLVKRPELFVRLAEELQHVRGLRFAMAGRAGNDRTHGELHSKIRSLNNLEYLGELSFDRVNQLLGRAHCLVNTSDAEGFSNTFIQAWMRGAVVLSLNADVDGLLASGQLGYLTGGVDALRARLETLMADRRWREELAERARAYSLRHFGVTNIDTLAALLKGETAVSASSQ